jgi:hypothetical protein
MKLYINTYILKNSYCKHNKNNIIYKLVLWDNEMFTQITVCVQYQMEIVNSSLAD